MHSQYNTLRHLTYYKQSYCKDIQFKQFPAPMKDSFRESIGVVRLKMILQY